MLTQQQRETRKRFLTASDVAAVLGLDHFKNAADVWTEKRFDLSPSDGNDATEAGDDYGPVLVTRAGKRRGVTFEREVWVEGPNGFMGGTFDGLTTSRVNACEAKTSGLKALQAVDEAWGEADTDQVPKRVIVQVFALMIVEPRVQVVDVPALLGRWGERFYMVERAGVGVADTLKVIEDQCGDLWQKYMVRGDDLPTDAPPPSTDVLRRIRREPAKTVDVPADLFEEARAKRALAKTAKDASEDADNRLKFALGDAEAGTCASGVVTFYEQHRKSYVVKESSYRVLRFKGE